MVVKKLLMLHHKNLSLSSMKYVGGMKYFELLNYHMLGKQEVLHSMWSASEMNLDLTLEMTRKAS